MAAEAEGVDVVRLDLAGQNDQRNGVDVGRQQGGDGVGDAGPRRDHREAGLAEVGGGRVALGGGDGGLLVLAIDRPEARLLAHGPVQVHGHAAGQGEHGVRAKRRDHGDRVGGDVGRRLHQNRFNTFRSSEHSPGGAGEASETSTIVSDADPARLDRLPSVFV
jgi:hypothetical protein